MIPVYAWMLYLAIVGAFTLLVYRVNLQYPLLRDEPAPGASRHSVTSYSLARCQMAFWTILVAGALFWLLVMYAIDMSATGFSQVFAKDLDPNVVALIGVSGATGILSAAVDSQKDSMVQTARLSSRSYGHSMIGVSRQIMALLPSTAAPNSAQGVVGALAEQQISALREQRARYGAEMNQPIVVIGRNKRHARHTAFWADLLIDENGNSLHRLQMVIFTLFYGLYFFVTIGYAKNCGVSLSSQALALMGVSNLVYLGFKVPGRSPEAPPPLPRVAMPVQLAPGPQPGPNPNPIVVGPPAANPGPGNPGPGNPVAPDPAVNPPPVAAAPDGAAQDGPAGAGAAGAVDGDRGQ